jgi:hypothetical protein
MMVPEAIESFWPPKSSAGAPPATPPTPLRDAIAQLSVRTPLGSAMKSKQWERTAQQIRDAAFFSATVEDERLLASMQAKIMQRLKLARSADAAEVTMDRSRFIA